MTKEILCTLGPASLDRRIISRLEQIGATLFRINLSHTKVADLPQNREIGVGWFVTFFHPLPSGRIQNNFPDQFLIFLWDACESL